MKLMEAASSTELCEVRSVPFFSFLDVFYS